MLKIKTNSYICNKKLTKRWQHSSMVSSFSLKSLKSSKLVKGNLMLYSSSKLFFPNVTATPINFNHGFNASCFSAICRISALNNLISYKRVLCPEKKHENNCRKVRKKYIFD